MKLHPNCKKRIIEELVKHLPEITVSNNIYINIDKSPSLIEIDKILPSSGELIENYRSWIDESPLIIFIMEELELKLKQTAEYSSEVDDKNIFDILSNYSHELLANRLIDDFENLPRQYKVYIKLNDSFKQLLNFFGNEIIITPSIKIILINESFLTTNKIETECKEVSKGFLKVRFA